VITGVVEMNSDGFKLKWGKRRQGGDILMGEIKVAARCFISSSTEHGRDVADGAPRNQRWHQMAGGQG
jgi:hypothetical protein